MIVKKKGFTLIELLVAVFVFMILFLIIMAFVRLAVGQTKSLHTKMLTSDLRNTMDILNQKMMNANYKEKITWPATTIHGFKYIDNIIGTVSKDGTCSFIGKNGDTISIYTKGCTGEVGPWPKADQLDIPITNVNTVKVTNFTVTGKCYRCGLEGPPSGSNIVPYITVVIEAEDKDPKYATDNKIKIETSYAMDYMTIKLLKSEAVGD